jgi:16S rRNA (adenine1518-N6/adenine1519-N6)-dimethyltransferase
MISPRSLLFSRGLRPKKQLGQNFLSDPATADTIVRKGGIGNEDLVLEIGAGLGALTIPLARHAKRVIAVEKDAAIAGILREALEKEGAGNVTVHEGSILDFDIARAAAEAGGKFLVAGNLPYNISSQVLVQLVAARKAVSRCVLMFQKELARRIMSPPGGREYGRLSVMLAYCAETRPLLTLGAAAFYPRPEIDSEVVEIRFKRFLDHPAFDEAFFLRVVQAAFSKRRKTLRNALATSPLPLDPASAAEMLERSGIDPNRRAETLSVAEFVHLSNLLYARG